MRHEYNNVHVQGGVCYYSGVLLLQKLSLNDKRGARASFKLSRKLPFIKKVEALASSPGSSEEPKEGEEYVPVTVAHLHEIDVLHVHVNVWVIIIIIVVLMFQLRKSIFQPTNQLL